MPLERGPTPEQSCRMTTAGKGPSPAGLLIVNGNGGVPPAVAIGHSTTIATTEGIRGRNLMGRKLQG
jgi:hypothetical protein